MAGQARPWPESWHSCHFAPSLAAGALSFAGGAAAFFWSSAAFFCAAATRPRSSAGSDGAFQVLDLPVSRIELLLMVGAEFCNCLFAEIDIALPGNWSAAPWSFSTVQISMPGTSCAGASADVSSGAAKAAETTRAEPADHGNLV